MYTVKFGASKPFEIDGTLTTDSSNGLFIFLPTSAVKFEELSSALANYGGDVYVFDGDGNGIAEYHGYEDKPSINTTWRNDGYYFSLYLRHLRESDVININTAIGSLNKKASDLASNVQTNKDDIATALEAIANLFETSSQATESTSTSESAVNSEVSTNG